MFFSRKGLTIILFTLIIGTACCLIFFQKPIRSFFYSLSQPVQQWFWSKGRDSSGNFIGFFRARSLKEENDNLKVANQELLSKIVELNQLKEDNQRLRQALDLGLAKDFQLKEAKILSISAAQDFIFINKGADEGILKGMPVITFQKVLIGKVDEVYSHSSRISLITHDKMQFNVQIQDSDIKGVAKGMSNQKLILDFIPKEENLQSGSIIITGALGGGFPAGLLVGKTGKIIKTDVEPFQQAEIELFCKIQDIDSLLIITNQPE